MANIQQKIYVCIKYKFQYPIQIFNRQQMHKLASSLYNNKYNGKLMIQMYKFAIIIKRFKKMSFERIKSMWRTTSDNKQQSILDKTQNFISNSFRRSTLPVMSTSEFEDYLASIPQIKRLQKKSKSGTSTSLKPQLFQKCLKVVDKQFFDSKYEIDSSWFDKKMKNNVERQQLLQQQLDQIQVCLFNQMSSRFDQILSSLDFIVVESQRKIQQIRHQNFQKVMKVSDKHLKLTALISRKKKLQAVIQLTSKLKMYKQFLHMLETFDSSETLQAFYTAIPPIKNNIHMYSKLRAVKNAEYRIQQAQSNLKQSFSDKVNERIFDYMKKDVPYQIQFWKKYINSNSILQDRQQDSKDHTALLDQSNFMAEQQSLVIIAKKQQAVELSIIQYVKKGWKDGQYSLEKIKSDIDTFLKSKHNAFMLDFRNFCDQYLKKHERHVENPSLTNLLKQIAISFCIKVFNYFFDIHKSMLLRSFSTSRKIFEMLINLSMESVTIDHKQKIKIMAEGFLKSITFLTRLILEKLVDIIDTKPIHQGINIPEIKQLVGVMENAQSFLQKQILQISQLPGAKQSFLSQFFQQLPTRFPVKLLETAKNKKLQSYLNKMHQNAMEVELKQKLQNQTWQPTDIPIFYYDSLHYLITGQSLNLRRNRHNLKNPQQSSMMYETSVLMDNREESFFQEPTKLVGNFRIIRNDIIINGQTYKVTESVLLLLEILEDYMTLAQNFPSIKKDVQFKTNQIIRTYNSCSCQLIVHAGAVALQKIKGKNITSRHLALSSLCLSFIIYIMQCLQKRIEIHQYEKLRQTVQEHIQIIIKKLNQILMYKANQAKADINLKNTPSKGTQSIVSSSKILLQILSDYYNKQILSRIFTKDVLNIYVQAISAINVTTRVEAQALKDDVAFFFGELKGLESLNNNFTEQRVRAEDVVRQAFQEL